MSTYELTLNADPAVLSTTLGSVSNLTATVALQGPVGPTGATGATGPGVPTGGTLNQYLRKASTTDYDTQWDSLDKTDVGLANVDNTSDLAKPVSTATQTALDAKEAVINKGAANGYAPLDSSAKVPAANLPSYVDDVLEYANLAGFPGTGTTGIIYVALDTNKIYRWSGSAYIEISPGSTASGDVVGPASSTDNAIARFDGTTGKVVQNSGATIEDVGRLTLSTSDETYPLRIANNATTGAAATQANEIRISPVNKTYGYGNITFYPENETRADVILQTHRGSSVDASTVGHRHFSIYSTNATQSATIKRLDLQYGVNVSEFKFQNSTLRVDMASDATALTISNTQATQNNAAIDITSKFGYKHTLQQSGGYGLNLSSGGNTLNGTLGLATFTQTHATDSANILTIDNRSANAKSLVIKNNTTENFVVNNTGAVTTGTWNGTDIAIADGGTGASTAAGALTNLGAVAKAGETMTGNLTIAQTSGSGLILNAPATTGTQSLNNEILFKPQNKTYGYGIISWLPEDDTQKDVIMQVHKGLWTDATGATIHRHFSLYTTNTARTSTLKRLNIPYAADYSQWDIQNSYVRIDSPGDNIGLEVVATAASAGSLKVANTNTSATGTLALLSNSGTGVALSVSSSSTTTQALDLSSKFGYKHTMSASGGYGLFLTTAVATSASLGLVYFQNTAAADTATTVQIDNRSAGKGLVVKNNATEHFSVSSAGNTLTSGYLRVGSTTAPTNVTAGDLTVTRLTTDNTAFGSSFVRLVGTMTDTTSGAQLGINATANLNPAAASSTAFRALNMSATTSSGNANTYNQIYGGWFETRHQGQGNVTNLIGAQVVNFINGANFTAANGSVVSVAIGLTALAVSNTANAPTGTITNAYAVDIQNPGVGTGPLVITNAFGVRVQAQTRATTLNVGIQIAAPSGATNNYALQLSDTGGTAAGGITFGTDVQLYRSAANTLKTDNSLVANNIATALSTKTAAYTITATDSVILADATTGTFTVTLPTAVGITGRQYTVKRISAGVNAVTIAATGAETIDGAAVQSLTTQYASQTYVSNGASWFII